MPFNGSGTFIPPNAPTYPAVDGTTIMASQFNNAMLDIYTGLTTCLTRDGQGVPSANLPMNGYKHTGAAAASATGQYAVWGQSTVSYGLVVLTAATTAYVLASSPTAGDTFFGNSGTADADDVRRVIIRGGSGTASSRGAYIICSGNEHASTPGDLTLVAGTTGEVGITGNTTVTGTLDVSGDVTLSAGDLHLDDSLVFDETAAGDSVVGNGTADGADVRRLVLRSGGAVSNTRGAYITLSGEDHASTPGDITLAVGAGGAIAASGPLSVNGAVAVTGAITATTTITATGNLTTAGDLHIADGVFADLITAGDTTIGHLTADGADNRRVVIRSGGGFGATRGAGIILAGNEATGTGGVNITCGSAAAISLVGDTNVTGDFTATGTGAFTGAVSGASFSGVGTALTALNATNLTSGTVPLARISGAVAYDVSAAQVDGEDVGYRGVPRVTSGFTDGKCTALTAGATINTSDLAIEKTFSIYNNSAADITITQGAGVTMRLNGTTSTGSLTLLKRGIATFWCNGAAEVIASGAVA